jgi:hypothetical protein
MKWSKDHTCSQEVLNAVEILWDSLPDDEECAAPSETAPGLDEQCCLALSKAAADGCHSSYTIRLQGSIAGLPAILLIDSGSSSSFISSKLASQLPHIQWVFQSAQVQIVGGEFLQSTCTLQSVPWSVEPCTFCSNFRVLGLSAFDAIVGVDWLQSFSPMQVYWEHKWLSIPYNGSWSVLQGIDAVTPESVYLQLFLTSDSNSVDALTEPLLPQIQDLVDSFASLFEPPSSLPPSRSCNHSIPLVPGAQPVFVWPYRYPPNLKDEIERQVKEMLEQRNCTTK